MVTPENSINIFFDKESSPGCGLLMVWRPAMFSSSCKAMTAVIPTHPFLDRTGSSGRIYAPFHEYLGVLSVRREIGKSSILLEKQLYFSSQRLPYPNADTNPEASTCIPHLMAR